MKRLVDWMRLTWAGIRLQWHLCRAIWALNKFLKWHRSVDPEWHAMTEEERARCYNLKL